MGLHSGIFGCTRIYIYIYTYIYIYKKGYIGIYGFR